MLVAMWLKIISFYSIKDTGFFLTATTTRPDIEKPLTIEGHANFLFKTKLGTGLSEDEFSYKLID